MHVYMRSNGDVRLLKNTSSAIDLWFDGGNSFQGSFSQLTKANMLACSAGRVSLTVRGKYADVIHVNPHLEASTQARGKVVSLLEEKLHVIET